MRAVSLLPSFPPHVWIDGRMDGSMVLLFLPFVGGVLPVFAFGHRIDKKQLRQQ